MSVIVEDVSNPLSDGQKSVLDGDVAKTETDGSNVESGQGSPEDKSEPETPKPHPMAFTIDFGDAKPVDNRRLEELAKKSQARHQRVQSMSASLTRPSPATQRPPMSGKLPRKAQGYNSEGYFSSDQEDSNVSSVKLRSSPLAQSIDKTHITSPTINRQAKSPVGDLFQPKRTSRSPLVDSIMSRSDTFTRQSLNLPLKTANSSYVRDVHRTPSYGNLPSSFYSKHPMADIIDRSPEGAMLTDISSPELDILTPDNGLSTPEPCKSPLNRKPRAMSETPDLLFKKCPPKHEQLFIDDDVDQQSNNSSTGTYTIEADNYTEEQKARMSIDRTFGSDLLSEEIEDTLRKQKEGDPDLVFDFPKPQRVITKEPKRDVALRSPLVPNTVEIPNKVSKDKNVLEISCCYESPTENDLAAQTSKQIKSTRSYLEKIKNRVRTITEKTFPKSPPKYEVDPDVGSFTSVTTSGVLSSKYPVKIEMPVRRRCSLAKSEIDQTDYVHRLSRESSVPVSLPSGKDILEDTEFESTVMKSVKLGLRDDITEIPTEQVVGKLSYLSLNRCKGDKTWIQEWADSVKKYNNNIGKDTDLNSTFSVEDRPPLSPRHLPGKPRSPRGGTPTKIPSPVGTLLHRRTPDLIPPQDTESYLLKTQNAITNLQAKLHSSRTNNFNNIPSQLTSSLISEKTLVSRLPLSQLSRSNSLNYRLRKKESSGDSSPLRSPGNYVITGSTKIPESTRILINSATRSLETDRRRDSNMNSPNSDRGHSNSSDDKTLSNRPPYAAEIILSPHRKTHARNRSFDGRNAEHFTNDLNNANKTVCLKTVLKNNALEAKGYPRIEQTRCQDNKKSHQRVFSDSAKQLRPVHGGNNAAFGTTIKRSSSFNTVNRNNNYLDVRLTSRRSSGQTEEKDYMTDESDNGSLHKSQDLRYKRQVHRNRIESPDLKSIAPANSPRCPNTPEMMRKFGPGLVRNSIRVTNKERGMNTRMSEPPMGREERPKPANHQSRRIAEPTRQAVLNRLTKSRSSTREFQPKSQEKGQKKPSQHRSSSALATKGVEFSNWKKRASYDPMKAAQEGRKRQQMARRQESNKDDLSSPSHSSPVHRSQSFHTTNIADLTLDYSSEETEDDQTLPVDPMVTSTHSDILDLRPRDFRETMRRRAVTNDVVMAREYVTNFQVNQPTEKSKRRNIDKRKTFLIDDITPTKENIDFLTKPRDEAIDKRKTFILDSDTNSTTNGSSPRNSSIFSHEKNSLTTGTSDTEGESGAEGPVVLRRGERGERAASAQPKQRLLFISYSSIFSHEKNSLTTGTSDTEGESGAEGPVVMRRGERGERAASAQPKQRLLFISYSSIFSHEKNSLTTGTSDTEGESGAEGPVVMRRGERGERAASAQPKQRYSGDYSMSSSTTSISKKAKEIQPRYLDISKYKNESSAKSFLRRDPSKTYVAVLGERPSKGSARQHEMEQKKQELEKWKRRASYDPRKAAALGKTPKTPPKTASNVLRSQSFHGPVLAAGARVLPPPAQIAETYDASSDNDF